MSAQICDILYKNWTLFVTITAITCFIRISYQLIV